MQVRFASILFSVIVFYRSVMIQRRIFVNEKTRKFSIRKVNSGQITAVKGTLVLRHRQRGQAVMVSVHYFLSTCI